MPWFLLACALYASAPLPDTLVVAPPGYGAPMEDWLAYRESQGRRIIFAQAPAKSDELRDLIRAAAGSPWLRHVVVVGDAPPVTGEAPPDTVPTCYLPAEASLPWARTPEIATDNPYADLDGDSAPELTLGRIPCKTPAELRRYLARVVRHETTPADDGARRLCVVAAPGRFSPMVDRAVEWVATSAFRQLVPSDFELDAIYASPGSRYFPAEPFRDALRRRLQSRAVAWVYMGHGSAEGLDVQPAPGGFARMFSCRDVDALGEGPHPTLAALVTCEAGAFDGERDCLAERLLLSPGGPLAVVAATRVNMPYGNSVLGIELLGRLFSDRQSVGDVMAESKRRALAPSGDAPLRVSVDQIAATFVPDAANRRREVVEHVAMYHLLGDPLLRVHKPRSEGAGQ